MDLVHDRPTTTVNKDRISNLPNDIIQHIFSFLDTRHAIQTCTLSRKWKNIWTSAPHLNLNSGMFRDAPQFSEFVVNVLSRRNNQTEVFTADLKVDRPASQLSIIDVINYAYSRNIRQLTMFWSTKSFHVLPPCIFNSHTLKHLTLHTPYAYNLQINVPKSPWDFPALETLNLSYTSFGDDGDVDDKSVNIFLKCLNLQDLTLHMCSFHGLEVFYICCPQLLNLTITRAKVYPKVFNVAAPQLQNLTASVMPYSYRTVRLSTPFQLSTKSLGFLEKVNLTSSIFMSEKYVPGLLNLFHTLCSAKYLILEANIIETLGSEMEKLMYEPCPFNNLKCLKITNVASAEKDNIATIIHRVRKYFLENSPSANCIID